MCRSGRAVPGLPVWSPAGPLHDLRVDDVSADAERVRVVEELLDAAAPVGHEVERGVDGVFLGGRAEFLCGKRESLVVQVDHRLHVSDDTAADMRPTTSRGAA